MSRSTPTSPFPTPRPGAAAARLDRRAVLLGGLATMAVAACGSDGGTEPAAELPGGAVPLPRPEVGDVVLAQLFSPAPTYARVGAPQRLPFGLSDPQRAPLDEPPAELTFQLYAEVDEAGGVPVGDPVVAPYRAEGLPRGYYAVRMEPDRPGIWLAQTEVGGDVLQATFQVGPEGGPGVVAIGEAMPAPTTATDDDDLGVRPLCTRDRPCGLHRHSLHDVVGAGTPVVVSVSTPAYCQTAICGPVLDLLVDAAADFPDVTFVHVEPWQQPEPGDPFANGPVAAVGDLGLDFEPSLFLVDGDGTLVERLDHIYDTNELRAALETLQG